MDGDVAFAQCAGHPQQRRSLASSTAVAE